MDAQSQWKVPPTPYLDRAVKIAFRQMKSAEDDLRRLTIEHRTVVAVYSAQGVIDNGGFRYFFESDWPGQPPYREFIGAYRRIGSGGAAQALAQAVDLFPFSRPHRYMGRRQEFMESLPESHWFFRDKVCGDIQVWGNLEKYVCSNAAGFWKRMPRLTAGAP